jgi:hypothetical protein
VRFFTQAFLFDLDRVIQYFCYVKGIVTAQLIGGKNDWIPAFAGMTGLETTLNKTSFRRKPESSAGEQQSTGCAE